MNNLTKECLTEIGMALKQFGTYSFDDKGPHEVMDIDSLIEKFRTLPAEKAAEILLELSNSMEHDGRGNYLANTLISGMEDWDELFEQSIIEDLY